MNVAYLSFDSNMFGSERSMLDVAGRFDRTRITTRLIMVRSGPLAAAARAQGIEVSIFPWLAGPFGANVLRAAYAAARLALWLRRRRIDVVELNRLSFGHLAVMSVAARLGGARTVVRARMHGAELTPLQKLTLLGADLIVAVSDGCIAAWRRGWSPAALTRRIRVIPDSRDVVKLKTLKRDANLLRELGIPQGAKVAGMVGAVVRNKRQDLFLKAAESVLKSVPDAWFVIVGGPLDGDALPYAESLKSLVGGSAAARVISVGYRDDALALMKNFDLLVLPSDHEAFGGVLIEAMALGVPIVAHRVDGTPEIIEDGATGLLIGEQKAELYADAMVRVLSDGALAARLSAAASSAVDRFDGAPLARRIEELYGALLKSKRGGFA